MTSKAKTSLSITLPRAYAGPALAAATVLGGKVPEIEYAVKLVPRGTQAGLKPVKLRGEIVIDPSRQDFFRFVTKERIRLKESQPILAEFLKVLASGGAYGLFAQMNPISLEVPLPIRVLTSTDSFICKTKDTDEPAKWTFMPLAALVTAGTHLLLAMAEKLVHDAGGEYAFMDTDSICVVSNSDGGLVRCPGGAHKLLDGREAIRALSWTEGDEKIVKPFASLNPFSGKAGEDSILKIEKSNYLKSENGSPQRRQLWGYCISAKRYCLSEYVGGTRRIVKPSAHGRGFLQPPYTAKDPIEDELHLWFSQAWNWLLASQIDGETAAQEKRKPWFDYVALMPLNITTPHVIRRFRNFPGFSPMNFLSCPQVVNVPKAGKAGIPPAFFMPYTEPKDAEGKDCWDQFGNRHHLPPESEIERHLDKQENLVPKFYAAFIRDHVQRHEAKFLGPDGLQCGGDTRGLLSRMHVEAGEKIPIRKESNRRWTQGEDVCLPATRKQTPQQHPINRSKSSKPQVICGIGWLCSRLERLALKLKLIAKPSPGL